MRSRMTAGPGPRRADAFGGSSGGRVVVGLIVVPLVLIGSAWLSRGHAETGTTFVNSQVWLGREGGVSLVDGLTLDVDAVVPTQRSGVPSVVQAPRGRAYAV